jgi:hypothetical protein
LYDSDWVCVTEVVWAEDAGRGLGGDAGKFGRDEGDVLEACFEKAERAAEAHSAATNDKHRCCEGGRCLHVQSLWCDLSALIRFTCSCAYCLLLLFFFVGLVVGFLFVPCIIVSKLEQNKNDVLFTFFHISKGRFSCAYCYCSSSSASSSKGGRIRIMFCVLIMITRGQIEIHPKLDADNKPDSKVRAAMGSTGVYK